MRSIICPIQNVIYIYLFFYIKKFNLNFGFKLNKDHQLNVYHNTFLSDREFSRTLTAVTFDGYEDENTRTLLAWTAKGKAFESVTRLAHVFESYKYFPDKNVDDF